MINAVWSLYGLLVAISVVSGNERNGCFEEDPIPVFMVHGLLANGAYMAHLEEKIRKHNPRRAVFNTYAYSDLESLTPLQDQIDGILGQEFRKLSDAYPCGIDVIGHSQGALLTRTLIQSYPKHNVRNYISIAGPHNGQYGLPPTIIGVLSELPLSTKVSSVLFHTAPAQKKLSIANLWHDPTQPELYLGNNTFLPYYNNEIWSEKSESYKKAILKLKNFIVMLGPDDGTIEPWQSGDFSYWNELQEIVNTTEQKIYKEDRLGLRTLEKHGRFIRYIIPGVNHSEFVNNDEIIEKYILPWLN